MKPIETDPGVRITRRRSLAAGAALPALWILSSWARGQAATPAEASAFFEAWAERAAKLAEESEPNEEASLHELCSGIARLAPRQLPSRMRTSFEGAGLESGPVFGSASFVVIEFELEPGAVIPAHNHVGWNFVSLGVEGEVDVRHYEPLPGSPAPDQLEKDFRLREVASAVLRHGRMSSLTRTRANIHGFRAGPKGARFIDFGVNYKAPGDGPRVFSVLDVEDEAVDARERTYTARWIGNIYAKD